MVEDVAAMNRRVDGTVRPMIWWRVFTVQRLTGAVTARR